MNHGPQRSGNVGTHFPLPERQPHSYRWKDLTRYQKALLRDFRKDGILLTPEQIVKMSSQIHHRPTAQPLQALHIYGETKGGKIEPLMEARRAEIDAYKRKEKNLDFATFWTQKNMSAALNLKRGFISLSAHGGIHHIHQPLRSYDITDLMSAFVAWYYANLNKPLPKEFKFTEKIREKMRERYMYISRILSFYTDLQK